MAVTYDAARQFADPQLVFREARRSADWVGIVGDVEAFVITWSIATHRIDAVPSAARARSQPSDLPTSTSTLCSTPSGWSSSAARTMSRLQSGPAGVHPLADAAEKADGTSQMSDAVYLYCSLVIVITPS